MDARIAGFLESKALSANSRAAYTYDLQQFVEQVGQELTTSKLQVYEAGLSDLKPAARRRKRSAVNQFLLYLYEQKIVDCYHHLKQVDKVKSVSRQTELQDLSVLLTETNQVAGQLIALLIWQLGLTPSEIQTIAWSDIDLAFRVLTIKKGDLLRVLSLPDSLMPYLKRESEAVYLFDKKGRPFSRQWFFTQLSSYLNSIGLGEMTAQKLREQHILRELSQGTSQQQLAKKLGLKTTQTLQTYEKHGY